MFVDHYCHLLKLFRTENTKHMVLHELRRNIYLQFKTKRRSDKFRINEFSIT